MTSPLELPGNTVSLNPFDDHANGTGGADLGALVDQMHRAEPLVVLRISAAAFAQAVPLLSVVQTAIHEGAHYRHYHMAADHIRAWQQQFRRPANPLGDRKAEAAFNYWMQGRARRGEITRAELSLLYSCLGWNQGTHPSAQVEAFLGMYRHYPREIGDRVLPVRLANQVRFTQLTMGSPAWARLSSDGLRPRAVNVEEPGHTSLKMLCVEAIVQHAQSQGACAQTDIRWMTTEVRDRRVAGNWVRENSALPEAILAQMP